MRRLTKMRFTIWLFALLVSLGTFSQVGKAQSPATQRIVRNIEIAIGDLKMVEAFRSSPVPRDKEFAATTLLKDFDDRLTRAGNYLNQIPPADRNHPAVVNVANRLAELDAYRQALRKNVSNRANASAGDKERHFAFLKENERYKEAVRKLAPAAEKKDGWANIGNDDPARLSKMMTDLAELDESCKTKYAGITNHPTYSITLDTAPAAWCIIANGRMPLAERSMRNSIQHNLTTWTKMLDEARANLEKNDGFLGLTGNVLWELVHERDKGKANLAKQYAPRFEAVGAKVPADLFAPIDEKVEALLAEVDRLAPTYAFPANLPRAPAIEAVAKAQMTKFVQGAPVLKTAMYNNNWDISKNNLGIILSRYRSGWMLYKVAGQKWCRMRMFTYEETYAGGGAYAKSGSVRLNEAIRYQKCQ